MKLSELRAICDAATPGPWDTKGDFDVEDMTFIVAAREYILDLIIIAECHLGRRTIGDKQVDVACNRVDGP